MDKILFVCNTTYQLYNAVNIITSLPKCEVDIIISSIIRTEGILEGCKRCGIFNKIVFVKKDDLPSYDTIMYNSKMQLLFSKKFIAEYNLQSFYNKVFFANVNKVAAFGLYLANYYHRFFGTEIVLYENGLGNYTNEVGIPILASRLLSQSHIPYNDGIQFIKTMYVYNPDSVQWNADVKYLPIMINDHEYIKNIFEQIFFRFNLNNIILPSDIFFLQPLNLLGCKSSDVLSLISHLSECIKPASLVLKQHPRKKEPIYDTLRLQMFNTYSALPWELLLLFEQNSTPHNYYTIFSTAAINSANYCEKRCNVFFLFNCLSNNKLLFEEGFIDYLSSEKDNFYNPVYIPNNFFELNDFIRKVNI